MPSPRRASAGPSAGRRARCAPPRCGRSSETAAGLSSTAASAARCSPTTPLRSRRSGSSPDDPPGRSAGPCHNPARAPDPPPAARRCRAARAGRVHAAGEQRCAADLRLARPERPGARPQAAPRRAAAIDGRELGARLHEAVQREGDDGRAEGRRRLRDAVGADVALVDQETLAGLIDQKRVEPLDRTLIANRKLIEPPFDDPPFDPGERAQRAQGLHGRRLRAGRPGRAPPRPRRGPTSSTLASTFPGQVAVPNDPAIVIGAALVATGHDWNSSAASDLDDARALLLPLRGALMIAGSVDGGRLRRRPRRALHGPRLPRSRAGGSASSSRRRGRSRAPACSASRRTRPTRCRPTPG